MQAPPRSRKLLNIGPLLSISANQLYSDEVMISAYVQLLCLLWNSILRGKTDGCWAH